MEGLICTSDSSICYLEECGGKPNHTYATMSFAFKYFKTAQVRAIKDQAMLEVRKKGKGKVPVLN
jgi:hypothetical protein